MDPSKLRLGLRSKVHTGNYPSNTPVIEGISKFIIKMSSPRVISQHYLMKSSIFLLVILCFLPTYFEALEQSLDADSDNSREAYHINSADIRQYSANNRGPPVLAKASSDESEWRFGLRKWPLESLSRVVPIESLNWHLKRTDSALRNVVWSQPDPRKSYSRPLALTAPPTMLEQPVKRPLPVAYSTPRTAAASLNLSSENRIDGPTVQVIQQKSPEMLTLIRYVPVLVGVPTGAPLEDATLAGGHQRTWPESSNMNLDADLLSEQQTASLTTLLSEPQMSGESAFSNPLRSLYMYLPSVPTIPIQPQLPQRHPLQQTSSPTSTTSAKAFSNYAARFFSMLRPTSLLSSVMAQPVHSQPTQIYLISAPSQLPSQPSLRQVLPNDDHTSPLRHASRTGGHLFRHEHPTTGTWSHPIGNSGYICVHSLHQRSPVRQQQQPVSSVSSQILLSEELASFDEPPITTSTTKAPETGTSLEELVTVVSKTESPVELLSERLRVSPQAPFKTPTTTTTTTSKPVARPKTSAPNKTRLESPPARRLSSISSLGEPIIPFTIRDKIESVGVHLDEPAGFPATNEAPPLASQAIRVARTSFLSSHQPQQHRDKSNPSAAALEVDYNRELDTRQDRLPLLLASTRRYARPTLGPKWAPGSQVGAEAELASSSSLSLVSTSSTLDGQPVVLASGPLLAPKQAQPTSIKPPDNSPKTSSSTTQLPAERGFTSSHNKQLSASDDSMDEFARLSESLQKNPMDLVDLQNSRSSFELPSQLESLSMLHEQQQQQHWQASSTEQSK